MMKTYLDVIEETVAYYSEDVSRRSVTVGGGCLYNSENGNQCAFQRCCYPIREDLEDRSAKDVIQVFGYDILKPEYQHLTDSEFWIVLQHLHDMIITGTVTA